MGRGHAIDKRRTGRDWLVGRVWSVVGVGGRWVPAGEEKFTTHLNFYKSPRTNKKKKRSQQHQRCPPARVLFLGAASFLCAAAAAAPLASSVVSSLNRAVLQFVMMERNVHLPNVRCW